jgi:trimethylamine corrinoid protein
MPIHFSDMTRAIIDGDRIAAVALSRAALDEGVDPSESIEKGFIPGIQEVGRLWESGDYFLPELIASAEAMKAAMAILRPVLVAGRSDAFSAGKVVIGTVEGDIHDIGKNLVAALLSANGFEVLDLGADVKFSTFIDRAVEAGADLICLSALLTTTMIGQRRFLELLRERGLRDQFKVLVGGAPTSLKWAQEIGADGYGENAPAAVREAQKLLGRVRS